jgi:hypothetical protein
MSLSGQVHRRNCTTRRTECAGSISTLLHVRFWKLYQLYIDKGVVVVLLYERQLRPSFSDQTRPHKPLHIMKNRLRRLNSTLPPVQYWIPSNLFIDKRDVVVLLWKSQLRQSFSDFVGPSRQCTPLHNM